MLPNSFMVLVCEFIMIEEPLIVFQLTSLDYVLDTEIKSVFGSSFSFSSFAIDSPPGPIQPNEFDCGIFVCMFLNDCSVAVNSEIIATVSDATIYVIISIEVMLFY